MALAWLRFPYTTPELDLLFRVAHAEDLDRGGRYEAHRAAFSLWTSPWPPKWRASCPEASMPMGTWYFHWGEHSGLRQIEFDAGYTLPEHLRELGQLELRALGHLKHGAKPTKLRPAS
jgi:hypothetical protein